MIVKNPGKTAIFLENELRIDPGESDNVNPKIHVSVNDLLKDGRLVKPERVSVDDGKDLL